MSLTNHATHLCKCNDVDKLQKHVRFHVYYHSEFGRSALKGADHMLSEKSQWTENGTMFVDLD